MCVGGLCDLNDLLIFLTISPSSTKQTRAVLSQGEPRDAAVNFTSKSRDIACGMLLMMMKIDV